MKQFGFIGVTMITFDIKYNRCVIADKMYFPGDVIEIAEILPLSPEDTIVINNTNLRVFTYALNEYQDCVVLGNGCLYNHNDTANASYAIEQVNDRHCMVYKATELIQHNEQIFINYLQDADVDLELWGIK